RGAHPEVAARDLGARHGTAAQRRQLRRRAHPVDAADLAGVDEQGAVGIRRLLVVDRSRRGGRRAVAVATAATPGLHLEGRIEAVPDPSDDGHPATTAHVHGTAVTIGARGVDRARTAHRARRDRHRAARARAIAEGLEGAARPDLTRQRHFAGLDVHHAAAGGANIEIVGGRAAAARLAWRVDAVVHLAGHTAGAVAAPAAVATARRRALRRDHAVRRVAIHMAVDARPIPGA